VTSCQCQLSVASRDKSVGRGSGLETDFFGLEPSETAQCMLYQNLKGKAPAFGLSKLRTETDN
jgi:hypothetical protein